MFSLYEVEAHPLFPVVICVADVSQQVANSSSDPDFWENVVATLDTTRVLPNEICDTGNAQLDKHMLESLKHFRLQLRQFLDAHHAAGDSQQRGHSLPSGAVDILRRWLELHSKHPYPDSDEKKKLSEETGLTVLQVNYWFTNARRRYLPRLAQDATRADAGGTIGGDVDPPLARSDDIRSWFMNGRKDS